MGAKVHNNFFLNGGLGTPLPSNLMNEKMLSVNFEACLFPCPVTLVFVSDPWISLFSTSLLDF